MIIINGFGSKGSYHQNQNDHDSDQKIWSPLVWYDPDNEDQITTCPYDPGQQL